MKSRGLGRIEVIALVALVALGLQLVALAMPRLREASRGRTCAANLRDLVRAMHAFEEAKGHLPAASRWTTQGMDIKQIFDPASGMAWWPNITAVPPGSYSDTTHENWVIELLPYLRVSLGESTYSVSHVISSPENEKFRRRRLAFMNCPSDVYNTAENEYRRILPDSSSLYARGNYAINGGSQRDCQIPGSSSDPCIDGFHYKFDTRDNSFQWWGNGVAGINKHFASDEFTSGKSHVVAIEELRAGVHRSDPRGVWSLGQIGGSITFSHGINGDATGPNNPKPNSDDIRGCDKVIANVGHEFLIQERMGCCPHCPGSVQASSRSMHDGGVYLAMAGGEVRFIEDGIDGDIWHLMHSRETPGTVYEDWPGENVARLDEHETIPITAEAQRELENSLGMRFVLIPPGEFIMGLPDEDCHIANEPEAGPQKMRIERPFYLGMHEVTRKEYHQLMRTSDGDRGGASPETERFPVTDVSWNDAVRFCNALSALPAERESGRVYRLPTEAEWEYACRSGKSIPYRFSRQRHPDDLSGDNGGHMRDPLPLTPVGSYPANGFGLHDMRGNVHEWTSDWRRLPSATKIGEYFKVFRGSDWRFSGDPCSATVVIERYATVPFRSHKYVGFRVVAGVTEQME